MTRGSPYFRKPPYRSNWPTWIDIISCHIMSYHIISFIKFNITGWILPGPAWFHQKFPAPDLFFLSAKTEAQDLRTRRRSGEASGAKPCYSPVIRGISPARINGFKIICNSWDAYWSSSRYRWNHMGFPMLSTDTWCTNSGRSISILIWEYWQKTRDMKDQRWGYLYRYIAMIWGRKYADTVR